MDVDNGLIESSKYILGIVLSGLMSMFAWLYKRRVSRLSSIDDSILNLSQQSKLVDLEIRILKEDISEIKNDLKKILYKL